MSFPKLFLDAQATDIPRVRRALQRIQAWANSLVDSGGGSNAKVLYVGGPATTLTYLGSSGPPYSVTQTFDISYSLPANELNATGEGLRITAFVDDVATLGATETPFTVRVAGATLVQCRRGVIQGGGSTTVTKFEVIAVRTSGNLLAVGTALTGVPNAANNLTRLDEGTLAVTFSSANTIDFTTQLNATSNAGSHTSNLRRVIIEKIKV